MIQLSEKQIDEALLKSDIDYINLYTNAYLKHVDNDLNANNLGMLDGYQHALLAFHFINEEVGHGGFVQLIQNGYGGYIFDNPTAKALKIFGAERTAKIIYKAKEIFDANRVELERETTDEEFTAMYVDFEVFDELEEQFYKIQDDETKIVAQFVDNNKALFAEII